MLHLSVPLLLLCLQPVQRLLANTLGIRGRQSCAIEKLRSRVVVVVVVVAFHCVNILSLLLLLGSVTDVDASVAAVAVAAAVVVVAGVAVVAAAVAVSVAAVAVLFLYSTVVLVPPLPALRPHHLPDLLLQSEDLGAEGGVFGVERLLFKSLDKETAEF